MTVMISASTETRQRDEQVDDCGDRDIDRAAQRSRDQPDRDTDCHGDQRGAEADRQRARAP